MSNRKESLKNSLGLTEYPWSSDDEDNPTTNTENAPSSNRRQNEPEPSNQPGPSTSNSGSLTILPGARRTQTRLERELYWSLLNNPNRMNIPTRPRASMQPEEAVDPVNLESPVASIQRILAIKRLSRNIGANLNNPPILRLPPNQSRNIIFTPSRRPEYSALRFGRIRRRPMSRVPPVGVRNPTLNPSYTNTAAEGTPEEPHQEEAPVLLRRSRSSRRRHAQDNETMEVEDSAAGASAEDEMLEIDEGVEENHDENGNEEIQAQQASGDENAIEEIPVPDAATAVLPLRPQETSRKSENSGDKPPESVQEYNRELLRLLECPVCLEAMEPPLAQCRRGHLVCGRCRARLAACPVCRTAFSSVRNRAMEAVAEIVQYPCRHGCGAQPRLGARAAHEASCGARRYRCPAPRCARRPPHALADLPLHFQTKHLSMLKVGHTHKLSMLVNSERHESWLVMAAQELFHLKVDVDMRAWGVAAHVAYIGPKCNASNFTYEVTIIGQKSERKLVYTRATHSDVDGSNMNTRRQDCFHLSLDQAVNFLRFDKRFGVPDKYIDFEVEINQLETAVENVPVETDS